MGGGGVQGGGEGRVGGGGQGGCERRIEVFVKIQKKNWGGGWSGGGGGGGILRLSSMGVKMTIFSRIFHISIFFFLFFVVLNIDCGYTLEPHQ